MNIVLMNWFVWLVVVCVMYVFIRIVVCCCCWSGVVELVCILIVILSVCG